MKNLFLSIALLLTTIASAQTVVPVTENKYNLPIIELNVNGQALHFIYDTGASTTVMSTEATEKLGVRMANQQIMLNGVEGVRYLEMSEDVYFNIGKDKLYKQVAVKDFPNIAKSFDRATDKKIVGILGMDIISELGISFDTVNRNFVVYGKQNRKTDKNAIGEDFNEKLTGSK